MRWYRGLFRLSGAFSRYQFSADYTASTFGFDLRQGQWATDAFARILVAHTALCGFSFGTRYLPTSRSRALIRPLGLGDDDDRRSVFKLHQAADESGP